MWPNKGIFYGHVSVPTAESSDACVLGRECEITQTSPTAVDLRLQAEETKVQGKSLKMGGNKDRLCELVC